MTTFHVQINDGPEQQVEVRSTQYHLAAVAALALLEHESRKPDPDIVKIWVPHLLPQYGPYFYPERKAKNLVLQGGDG